MSAHLTGQHSDNSIPTDEKSDCPKMSKRRRTSSVASRGLEDEDAEPSPEPSRKRKKMDPGELCQQIYDIIRNHKKDDGTLLCDAFIRVPKRRQEPGYYEVVSNPIDLLKVQQKLKTDEYEDADELASDIQLMVNNAKAFYKRTSQEYRDACDLWELFNTTKTKLLEAEMKAAEEAEHKGKIILKVGKLARKAAAAEAKRQDVDTEDTSEGSTNPDDDGNQYEDLFTAIMTTTDTDNRLLHTCFQLLPSKKIGSESAQAQPETKPIPYEMAPSPLIPKIEPEVMMEDSLDGGPPSLGSGDTPAPVLNVTPVSAKKKSSGKKFVTGYILYSSDVRRTVAANHPDSNFGEISRIVGNEWRNLSAHEKQTWVEKAAKVNEETAAEQAEAEACPSPAPSISGQSGGTGVLTDVVYECCWENCDWQFEDITDCIDHSIHETNGHVQMYFAAIPPSDCEFQCQWRGCTRVKKGASPFPNVQRLARHIKEVHIQKGNGRVIPVHERSSLVLRRREPTYLRVPAEKGRGSE